MTEQDVRVACLILYDNFCYFYQPNSEPNVRTAVIGGKNSILSDGYPVVIIV